MLIHIDRSATADVLSRTTTARSSHTALENLLLAHFEGNHILSLLPDDAAALKNASPPWSDRARRALEHVEENYPQIAGVRWELPWTMELGLGPKYDGKAHREPSFGTIIRAQLHTFEKAHTAHCAILLGENMTDADFFRELGLIRCAARGWEAVDLVCEPRGGGGSTMAQEYDRAARRGYLVLAIADTDQRHPKSSEGGTYSKLRERAKEYPEHQRARPLPTRTIEGLVPLTFYRKVFEAKDRAGDKRLGILARLDVFFRSAPSDIDRYAPLKDGICLYQVEHSTNDDEGAYWAQIAKNARRDSCTQPSAQRCTKRQDCKCYVVDALGGGALSDVVRFMQSKKSKKRMATDLGLEGSGPRSDLADEVLSWGVAFFPLLT